MASDMASSEAAVVFPHQLFIGHPVLSPGRSVYLVEDQLFFGDSRYQARFHRQKLMLHRASMRAYRDRLVREGYDVHYVEYEPDPEMDYLFDRVADTSMLMVADPTDYILQKRLEAGTRRAGLTLQVLESPCFVSERAWLDDYFASNGLRQTSFYIEQRKRLGVLVDDGSPAGGKWSYDRENRKSLPDDIDIPDIPDIGENEHVREARRYVERRFPSNPGSIDDFIYPVTHADAERWLSDFLEKRLSLFGDYEDAIARDETFLFHSVLSPLLNIGLLTPRQALDATIAHAGKHDVPLNDLEGFIRQLIGWREFMRGVYRSRGTELRNGTFWEHDRAMPAAFYDASTGIEPVDVTIRRLYRNAYTHHIERLMVLGNFMLLCEIHPREIYRWFMELYIDAYDWVMVPNVYGMSQYAAGGVITTKPYISSSNYIRKMSDYGRGEWCDIWDGLYWRFIWKHRDVFADNPRMRVMTAALQRMKDEKLQRHLSIADTFLHDLWEG
jgi:deoxyribodipyrimidine photolyase-related protein